MCISLKFCTRRGQVLSLSLSVALIFCFSSECVLNLSPGYLSLSRSFFCGENSQSAHSLFWVCFFCRKKGGSTQPFFFQEDPKICLFLAYTHAKKLFVLAGGNKKRTGRRQKFVRETTRHFFSFSFSLSFFLLFPTTRKNEHQYCSGTSDRADAGEFRPEKFFFLFFFFFFEWWWFWGVPDAVALRVAVNRCGL